MVSGDRFYRAGSGFGLGQGSGVRGQGSGQGSGVRGQGTGVMSLQRMPQQKVCSRHARTLPKQKRGRVRLGVRCTRVLQGRPRGAHPIAQQSAQTAWQKRGRSNDFIY